MAKGFKMQFFYRTFSFLTAGKILPGQYCLKNKLTLYKSYEKTNTNLTTLLHDNNKGRFS